MDNQLLARRGSWSLVGSLALALAGSGCSDDEPEARDKSESEESEAGRGGRGGGGGSGGAPDGGAAQDAGGAGDKPLYAMMTQVYGPEDRTVYVTLSETLDLPANLSVEDGREFAGVANFAPVGGRLLISSGEEPVITEFEIGADLSWKEGKSVSFAEYPSSDNANFYYQYILDENTAYMPFDVYKRLVWNPTEMTIEGVHEDSEILLERDGLMGRIGGNRNAIHFDGPVLQAFIYQDDDNVEFSPDSYVAIYDEQTHEEKSVVTLPCSGLSMPSQDEDGYTYYGTWGFVGLQALFGGDVNACIARLKPDHTLDEAWTTDLRDITEGRYHNNFRYINRGRAIANVFHHELIDADWKAGHDPELAERVMQSGEHWKLWLFDLEEKTGKPVEGVDRDTSSGAQFAVLDGRTFIFVPFEDWAKTAIYELDDNGKAIERSVTTGDVFKWVKVR